MVKGYPEDPKTIGDHLRRRRLELGLYQTAVAAKLGVHIETLKNWERGVGAPMIRHMPKIIEFLGYDPEPEPDTLPARIAYARRRHGLTQEELAAKIQVDPTTIYRWENGECQPSVALQKRLEGLLGKTSKPPSKT